MSCGYLTRIVNLGDAEMYCTLVHNELVGGHSRTTPPHSMLMLDILGWRHQNLKYNTYLYFKHVVPLILSIYNPVLIIGIHFHPLSQVPFYHNNTHRGFTVNIVPTDKIFLLKQERSFKYSYLHVMGSKIINNYSI